MKKKKNIQVVIEVYSANSMSCFMKTTSLYTVDMS